MNITHYNAHTSQYRNRMGSDTIERFETRGKFNNMLIN